MILTCSECHTKYRLDPQMLGEKGRTVACTTCRHQWFQTHVPERDIGKVMEDTGLDIVDAPAAETAPPSAAPTPAPPEESFEAILQQTANAVAPAAMIPDAVKPMSATFTPPPPAVYRPMGMSAAQFGVLTFLACCFVSLSIAFLVRAPVVHLWPPAARLYRTLGIAVKAPGEGLRLGEMIAENRIDKSGRVLAVEAKLSNMTPDAHPYPALRVTLASAYGETLKQWTFDGKDAKPLAPGETVPVKLELKDAPEGGADVGLKVVEP